jgi:hypothetical protein
MCTCDFWLKTVTTTAQYLEFDYNFAVKTWAGSAIHKIVSFISDDIKQKRLKIIIMLYNKFGLMIHQNIKFVSTFLLHFEQNKLKVKISQ